MSLPRIIINLNMSISRDHYIKLPPPITYELLSIFNTKDNLTIFDIGSCEGEDSIRYSRLFPNSRIYAVEALQSNLLLLESNLEKYSVANVEIIPFALSDEPGLCDFYVSLGQPDEKLEDQDWDYGNKSSSLLPPNKHLDLVPWLKFADTTRVESKTLIDVCIERGINSIDFVHMDVQGAELKVLKGAKELIKNIKVIWLEVESVELYKDQPLKYEVEEFMRQHNFVKLKDTVDSVSGDQLYINSDKFSNKLSLIHLILRLRLHSITNHILCLTQKLVQKMKKIAHFGYKRL